MRKLKSVGLPKTSVIRAKKDRARYVRGDAKAVWRLGLDTVPELRA